MAADGEAMKVCCAKFAEQSNSVQALVGGGGLYPPGMQPTGQIEYYEGWNVNGCCGGGCYVLGDIEYCPFCGAKLEAPE